MVDLELIEKIYQLVYQQKLRGEQRHQLLGHREISRVVETERGVELSLRHALDGALEQRQFDAVVLATGYRRDYHRTLLAGFADYIENYAVDRQYRLQLRAGCPAQIYLQGSCEHSHGLSDTLLSVLSMRSEELVASIFADQPGAQAREPLRLAVASSAS
ncbi:L-ornithine N(5)-monooxygenase [compost metagenome]